MVMRQWWWFFCPLRCVWAVKGAVLFCPVPAFRGWGNVAVGFVLLHSRQTGVLTLTWWVGLQLLFDIVFSSCDRGWKAQLKTVSSISFCSVPVMPQKWIFRYLAIECLRNCDDFFRCFHIGCKPKKQHCDFCVIIWDETNLNCNLFGLCSSIYLFKC